MSSEEEKDAAERLRHWQQGEQGEQGQKNRRGMTKRKAKAVELLLYWRQGGDSFTCQLYSLIAKADVRNTHQLALAFPVEVKTWIEWHNSPTEEAFFNSYDLIYERF